MNNLLQRMPQSAKVGLVAALLVALVGSLYYFAIVQPNQIAQQNLAPITPAPTPAASAPTEVPSTATPTPDTSAPTPNASAQASAPARSLEVVPLPFLVTESATPEATTTGPTKTAAKAAAKPQSDVPPNPFVPLVVATDETTPTSGTVASSRPIQSTSTTRPTSTTPPISRPSAVVASTPIPSQTAKIRVTQPTRALPGLPNLPTATPTPTITVAQVKPTPTATNTKPSTKPVTNPVTPAQPKDLVKAGGQARLAPGGSRGNVPGILSMGSGALPIRLAPLDRELVKPTPIQTSTPTQPEAEPEPTPADPALDTTVTDSSSAAPDFTKVDTKAPATQSLEPRSNKPTSVQRPVTPTPTPIPTPTPTPTTPTTQVQATTPILPPNPVAEYIQAQSLKLANVVLGSTNIAIFQSREGYMVVPVGNKLPGSDILLKSLNTKEALLVQGSQELNLSIEKP